MRRNTSSRLNRLSSLGYAILAGLYFANGCLADSKPNGSSDSIPQRPAVIIPLSGSIGCDYAALRKDKSTPFITSSIFRAALAEARRLNPIIVILDISGPGGDVSEMLEIVRALLDAQNDSLRIAAWIGPDVYSADAEIALACRELVTRQRCSLGAAVMYRVTSDGSLKEVRGDDTDAVRRKFYSAKVSVLQEAQDRAGRPRCVEESMRVLEAQLWWSPVKGFAAAPANGETGWERLDGPSDILTLSSAQLLRFGICRGQADTRAQLCQALGLPANTPVRDLQDFIRPLRFKVASRALEDARKIDDIVEAEILLEKRTGEAAFAVEQARWSDAIDRFTSCQKRINHIRDMVDKSPVPEYAKEEYREDLRLRFDNFATLRARAEAILAEEIRLAEERRRRGGA